MLLAQQSERTWASRAVFEELREFVRHRTAMKREVAHALYVKYANHTPEDVRKLSSSHADV
jgi:hypothetical protein